MIKTFHSKKIPTLKTQIKKFKTNTRTVESITKVESKKPTVLFKNKIQSLKSDIISVDENMNGKIDKFIYSLGFENIGISSSDKLIIENIYNAIEISNMAYQIEFGKSLSKEFQKIQSNLSDYAKIGEVDSILDLGENIIEMAINININIFNKNKLSTKLYNVLGTRKYKVNKLKHEFDFSSDQIDEKINKVYDNMTLAKKYFKEFDSWIKQLVKLHNDVILNIIALSLKIESFSYPTQNKNTVLDMQSINHVSEKQNHERWERKLNTLNNLKQSIVLTSPQVDIYKSNLASSFERLESIKVNIIHTWKQQFLTIIAVDESNETSIYEDLKEVQNNLKNNIKELC